jgi:hypothetical protein
MDQCRVLYPASGAVFPGDSTEVAHDWRHVLTLEAQKRLTFRVMYHHSLKPLASGCSLRLVPVCSILAAKTMRKGRSDPRNDPHNDVTGELQAQAAGASISL